eukprot:4532679-Prymnesium_polylepis.1
MAMVTTVAAILAEAEAPQVRQGRQGRQGPQRERGVSGLSAVTRPSEQHRECSDPVFPRAKLRSTS